MALFSFQCDGTKALERLDAMSKEVDGLRAKTSETFMRWQVNDMNRNKPHVQQIDNDSFLTHFWSRPWRLRHKT